MESQRDEIRQTLAFTFRPLEGKGEQKLVSLCECVDRPYKPLLGELMVALWEITPKKVSEGVVGDVNRLRRFVSFLEDTHSLLAMNHTPTTAKDLTFGMLRDYEHWLRQQPATMQSKREQRREVLVARLKTPLPTKADGAGKLLVAPSRLATELGWEASYISKDAEFRRLVEDAASAHGQTLRPFRSLRARQPKGHRVRLLAPKYVEEAYYTLGKVIRRILDKRRHLLAPDFQYAELTQAARRGALKTPALAPLEEEAFRKACVAAVRRTKKRILIDGPAAAKAGLAEPEADQDPADWAMNDGNLLAYLSAYEPGKVVWRNAASHPWFAFALKRRQLYPYDLAKKLYPEAMDLLPFICLMGLSEHAPLNLASIIGLAVHPEGEVEHCLQRSPTPGHKRVVFGKARALVDRDTVDVPARGALDLPCLIQTVIDLTATIRPLARPDDRNSLWLYLSEKKGVLRLPATYVTHLLPCFLEQENVGLAGERVNVFFRRLRPTSVSESALTGGLEEAQRKAGHAEPVQTYSYAVNPTTEPKLRKTIQAAQSKALASIQSGFAKRPSEQDIQAVVDQTYLPRGAAVEILRGQRDKLFNACSDDRNGLGPAPKGKTCGKYEACLICANSLILQRHLPRLIAYQEVWLSQADNMSAAEWQAEHELNCEIVNVHLQKFDSALVQQIRSDVQANPPPLPYHRFKQS